MDDGKVNAVGNQLIDELHAALDQAQAEASAVCFVGNEKAFSAGFDLSVMNAGDMGDVMKLVGRGGELIFRVFLHPQPTVAAVTGHALAAGVLLVLACDTRIAQDKPSKIGLNETAIGMTLPVWAVELAAARLSKRATTKALIQAEVFDPDGALAAGYVDAVSADAVGDAIAEARRLGALPGAAYAGTKLLLRQEVADRAFR
jgi:enoyl-CoA hydratase